MLQILSKTLSVKQHQSPLLFLQYTYNRFNTINRHLQTTIVNTKTVDFTWLYNIKPWKRCLKIVFLATFCLKYANLNNFSLNHHWDNNREKPSKNNKQLEGFFFLHGNFWYIMINYVVKYKLNHRCMRFSLFNPYALHLIEKYFKFSSFHDMIDKAKIL